VPLHSLASAGSSLWIFIHSCPFLELNRSGSESKSCAFTN
jgi:hypothetical protein